MSNLNTHGVSDYASALKFLNGKPSKTLCYATYLVDMGQRTPRIDVIHHRTAIIRYYPNGEVWIRNGGYLSMTTTNRLHRMTPPGVCVAYAKGGSVTSPFYAGEQPYDWTRVL